jgi:Tfp pilus assembly protein PilX
MPCSPHRRIAPRPAGFAVVWVLVLTALIALLGAGALHDTWFAQSLAGTRLFEQRAAALAELGLRAAAADLAAMRTPDESVHSLHPAASPTDHLTTRIRKLNEQTLTAGFSAGRFAAQEFEIESKGYSARSAQRVLVQGMRRVVPSAQTP